jgi:16S rRNA (cytidine1402-2'-O)-methyltransferase
MGYLYIVATPIGNLGDMTFRAVDILKTVDFIAAEDTRHSGILLSHYGIETRMVSFHAQSSDRKTTEIVDRIRSGESCAYISDAGTPCISDPGFRLVRVALEQGIVVIPIPGASALTTLVSVSGIPADKFTFLGFLPHKKGRQTRLKSFVDSTMASVFYESVHRFPKLLRELEEHVGRNRQIVVGRELTKMHEDVFRGTVGEALDYFDETNTKGEFVVLVSGV